MQRVCIDSFTLNLESEVRLSSGIVLVLVVVLEHPAFAPRKRLTQLRRFGLTAFHRIFCCTAQKQRIINFPTAPPPVAHSV